MARINDFKAALLGGGARANQFEIQINFPEFALTDGDRANQKDTQLLCKSAVLPSSTVSNIPVQFRGRIVNLAGERTFAAWSATIINDTGFTIRNALEKWSGSILSYETTEGITIPRDYQKELLVTQLDRNGEKLKTYKFIDAYPTSVGEIQLDYETDNTIETYTVEFTYNYFTTDFKSVKVRK